MSSWDVVAEPMPGESGSQADRGLRSTKCGCREIRISYVQVRALVQATPDLLQEMFLEQRVQRTLGDATLTRLGVGEARW
jgi:hypothetical protein